MVCKNDSELQDEEWKKQNRKQNAQDQKTTDNIHARIMQKMHLNGILQPQVRSSSSSSSVSLMRMSIVLTIDKFTLLSNGFILMQTSPKLDQNNRKISSNSKPVVAEREALKDGGKLLLQEPQIIQKIDLNGVLPQMGSQMSSSQVISKLFFLTFEFLLKFA